MPTLLDPGPTTFEAVLQPTPGGAACFVDFPHDLKALYGKGNLVPVRVTWDERVVYRGSLAKMGGPRALVLCRKDVLAELGKRAGDAVHVCVELDTAPRAVEVPEPLGAALRDHPEVAAAWERLSPSCQRAYADWIGSAKRAETAQARVVQAIPQIAAGKPLR
jgi:hypothetical protein